MPLTSDPTEGPSRPVTFQNIVYGVALALMVGWILHLGSRVLVPMVLGLLLSYVVVGVARLIAAVPVLGPLIPSWARITLAALLIGFGLTQIVFLFAANITVFAVRLPEFQQQFTATVQSAANAFGFEGDLSWDTMRNDVLAQINMQRALRSGLTSTAALLGWLLVVLLNVVFMLLERRSFDAKLNMISRDPARVTRTRAVIADINARVGRYLAVKTMINIVLGLASYVVMRFYNLEFAALWAIVIAMLAYIPYVGSYVGVILPGLMAIVQFGEIEPVLILVVALGAVQFIQGSIIEPQVMGNTLNLSPYAILISLTFWASLWGIAGAIVSVPITAVIVIVLSEFPGTRSLALLLSNGEMADK